MNCHREVETCDTDRTPYKHDRPCKRNSLFTYQHFSSCVDNRRHTTRQQTNLTLEQSHTLLLTRYTLY